MKPFDFPLLADQNIAPDVVAGLRTRRYDFLVTVNSARLTGFRELASSGDNHSTVANPANALVTIAGIRTAHRSARRSARLACG